MKKTNLMLCASLIISTMSAPVYAQDKIDPYQSFTIGSNPKGYTLDNDAIERGVMINKFSSPRNLVEECVMTKRLPGWIFPDEKKQNKLTEKEAELCGLNFYSSAGIDRPYGICPKQNSTNPGILFMSLGPYPNKSQFENQYCKIMIAEEKKEDKFEEANPKEWDVISVAQKCSKHGGGTLATNQKREKEEDIDTLAKFKSSVSCSYTPTMISAYHMSQVLDTLNVPPVVLRTMDLKEHMGVREKAIKILAENKERGTIAQTWGASWNKTYTNSSYYSRVFTTDGNQIYGGLAENVRGEKKYGGILVGKVSYDERYTVFPTRQWFKNLMSQNSLSSIVGSTVTEQGLQMLVQMRDTSDMMIMDYLLGQIDRPHNTHYFDMLYYSNDGVKFKAKKVKKVFEDIEEGKGGEYCQAKYQFKIKEMILKDNDCGGVKGNEIRKLKYLDNIAHISPKTYYNLLKFAEHWRTHTTAMKEYAKSEWLYTDQDIASFNVTLRELSTLLKSRCESGLLKLDLDVESHFSGKGPATECSIPASGPSVNLADVK